MTTLSLLLDECYRRLNFTATPTASVTARLTGFLNDAHRRLLTAPGMELLRDAVLTFQTAPGQRRYALPPVIAQVKAITRVPVIPLPDQVTDGVEPAPLPATTPVGSPRRLSSLRRHDYRRLDPGSVDQGEPEGYVPIGEDEVAQQPTTLPTGLWIVSTSAADVGRYVRIEARTLRGAYLFSTQQGTPLNGLTRVAVRPYLAGVPVGPAPTDLASVQRFALDQACQGYVDLWTAATGGQRLSRIEPSKTRNNFFIIELAPAPPSAAVYEVDYTRQIRELTDTDAPFIPKDFLYLLVLMACRREYVFSDDKLRYEHMAREEAEALRAFRAWVLYPPDYRVRNGDPELEGDGSNLGGAFPSGRW